MKIVHVDETFHPSYGYQVNPLAKFQSKQGNEIYILTVSKDHLYPVYKEFGDDGSTVLEEDKIYESETKVKIIRIETKGYFMKRAVYSNDLFTTIEKINPDVIFVHCVETLTGMRFLLRKKMYPLMFDSHMLAMASQNKFAKIYEKLFKVVFASIINRKKYEVIRTQDDDYVNSHLGISNELTPFISFGTDTLLFSPSIDERNKFRIQYGISDLEFVVVYTGKLTEAKNGLLLARAFEKKFSKNITLIVVGNVTNDAYGHKVQSIFDKSENRIIQFPTQRYLELPKFYQAADLSVFPKQCSMSFYDAQSCGLPVLSEDNNVNEERCSHQNGENFKSDDVDSFRDKIEYFASLPKDKLEEYKKNSRYFVEKDYSYERIAQLYTVHLQKAIDNFKK